MLPTCTLIAQTGPPCLNVIHIDAFRCQGEKRTPVVSAIHRNLYKAVSGFSNAMALVPTKSFMESGPAIESSIRGCSGLEIVDTAV